MCIYIYIYTHVYTDSYIYTYIYIYIYVLFQQQPLCGACALQLWANTCKAGWDKPPLEVVTC